VEGRVKSLSCVDLKAIEMETFGSGKVVEMSHLSSGEKGHSEVCPEIAKSRQLSQILGLRDASIHRLPRFEGGEIRSLEES
jgi:hypothetical protein